MTSFSIIICTHNPEPSIFGRVLRAVGHLQKDNFEYEVIIVDNNSSSALEERKEIKEWIDNHPDAKIVKESKPGLTAARIAGVKKSKYEWIVFFDDDNEPASDFLVVLSKGIGQYRDVNCWGPGNINVEYVPNAGAWFQNNKQYFQKRKENTKFGSEPYWQTYYPIGTGLCIEKKAMESYVVNVEQGIYDTSDRTGRSLVSGGDTQIVLHNQKQGRTAGKLGGLSLNHLIVQRKATMRYLSKQKFWTAASYHRVLYQVYSDFSEGDKELSFTFKDLVRVVKKFYYEIKVKKSDWRTAYLSTCSFLGEIYTSYVARDIKPGTLLRLVKMSLIRK